jgi:beta-lactamase superfamily II metal-dependent hydrolase
MARRPANRRSQSFVCHLLNMGRTKYGDCIVVECGGKTILVDGGHPGDDKDREDRPSIPSQLEEIFGHEAPFHFDLLVVTHCHQDHIGCLPKLVAKNIISCDRALVADEKLGFGLNVEGEGDARLSGVGSKIRSLVAALSEEDHSSLRGDELDEFLADAASLQDNYTTMLQTLARNADLVRYRQGTPADRAAVASLTGAMSATGMEIFGPTADQLVHCAQTIQGNSGDAADMLADMGDPSESLAEAYLRIMASSADAASFDRKIGWAKNCQSIVMAFGGPGERVLLPGDMQFAEPGIPDIATFVQQLRRDVAAGGPYVFAKTPHHTSHNGTNEELLGEWGWPPLLGHSGGYNDPDHPYPETLDLLKSLKRSHSFTYARTDHNGRVTVEPAAQTISGEKSRLNDFTPNPAKDDLIEATRTGPSVEGSPQAAVESSPDQFVEITFVRIPYSSGRVSIDGRVIEIDRTKSESVLRPGPSSPSTGPGEGPPPDRSVPNRGGRPAARVNSLAAGRKLPPLLFATDLERLRQNVGEDADRAIGIIRDAGHRVVTAPGVTLAEATRRELLDKQVKGVVLLGGYDVVPSQRVDVLGAELRARMAADLIARDRDGFVVWSDDIYGDREPDGIPEVPVSRIPDARVGAFLMSMLTSGSVGQPGKFALRNRERPFADAIFPYVPGNGPMQISAPQGIDPTQRQLAAHENIYFMLHGDYRDGTVFWGEDDNGNTPAISVSSLPQAGVSVAFSGCCWGALTVSEPAFLAGDRTPTPRMPERSIALSILKAGAKAFVGATGVHYSPGEQGGFFGGPLHRAFWDEIGLGVAPAEALLNARNTYLTGIPHGRPALWNQAVERKLYKQFTCLGLGW